MPVPHAEGSWSAPNRAQGFRSRVSHEGLEVFPRSVGSMEPERTERVPESQYKRHRYADGVMMLTLSIGVWIVVAKSNRRGPTASQ
jgi:hypothetical protein